VFVGWVVMGKLVQVEVGVGRFTVHFMPQGAVRFPVYVDVQKREVAIFFYFHGEFYVM
jgi:hypothetical protein